MNWGILPYINFFGIKISTYSIFVLLGLFVGILIFWILGRKKYEKNENTFYIIYAGIIGGTLGAKIPIWIIYFNEIKNSGNIEAILGGRTVTGGIIGGLIAIIIVRKILNEKTRFGNEIAPSLAFGIAIGRIGCFLHGCCYGIPTSLPWGINFGDGILRNPTQIYEMLYLIFIGSLLLYLQKKNFKEGVLFELFLILFFGFRFFIEFIRNEPKVFYFLTGYQLISLLVIFLVFINIKYIKK